MTEVAAPACELVDTALQSSRRAGHLDLPSHDLVEDLSIGFEKDEQSGECSLGPLDGPRA